VPLGASPCASVWHVRAYKLGGDVRITECRNRAGCFPGGWGDVRIEALTKQQEVSKRLQYTTWALSYFENSPPCYAASKVCNYLQQRLVPLVLCYSDRVCSAVSHGSTRAQHCSQLQEPMP
jgi:hypothetical protein